jgi:alkylated DNA repair dioxygenase AlkB
VNAQLEKNNFLFIPNFISSERAKFLENEFFELEKTNRYVVDDQAPNSPAIYNFKPFLELLCEKTPQVSSLIKETVLPTYSYARIYKNNEILENHVDRQACEISLSVHLGSDAEWDITIQKPNEEKIDLNLKPGDAVLYLGCTAFHGREKPYTGQNYCQLFLHYVRSRGPNAWTYFDKKL